jgi:hypothetical protein
MHDVCARTTGIRGQVNEEGERIKGRKIGLQGRGNSRKEGVVVTL